MARSGRVARLPARPGRGCCHARAVARARAVGLRRGRARLRRPRSGRPSPAWLPLPLLAAAAGASGGLVALVWVALKVGALSYGGGFVIIPLMQADAVNHYHWMTERPVPQRGGARPDHAGAGGPDRRGRWLRGTRTRRRAASLLVAFAPSFAFILLGARRFDRLRENARRARVPRWCRAGIASARSSARRSRSARALQQRLAVRRTGRRRVASLHVPPGGRIDSSSRRGGRSDRRPRRRDAPGLGR